MRSNYRKYGSRIQVDKHGDDVATGGVQNVALRGTLRPTLMAAVNGTASWAKDKFQKSATGWTARLFGGLQTGGASWAALYIPIDDMPINEFTSAQWTYNMTNNEVYGVNMVIWLHDIDDHKKRMEVTQSHVHADLAKAQGENTHVLNTDTAQFFYFGENTTGSGLVAGGANQYKWTQFQTDTLFKGWTIYRISLEMGWYSTGTFEPVWLHTVTLNEKAIPLGGDEGVVGQREPFIFRPGSTALASGMVLSGTRSGGPTVATTAQNTTIYGTEVVYEPYRGGKIDGVAASGIVSGQITIGTIASAATVAAKLTARIRNKDGTNVDILALTGTFNVGATNEVFKTYDIPHLLTTVDFNQVPFGFQIGVRCDKASTVATSRIMESSYIQGEFEPNV